MSNVKIIKKKDDLSLGTKVIRVSLGGNKQAGYYCTYRGTLQEAKEVIVEVMKELSTLEKEPDITPDLGKRYA